MVHRWCHGHPWTTTSLYTKSSNASQGRIETLVFGVVPVCFPSSLLTGKNGRRQSRPWKASDPRQFSFLSEDKGILARRNSKACFILLSSGLSVSTAFGFQLVGVKCSSGFAARRARTLGAIAWKSFGDSFNSLFEITSVLDGSWFPLLCLWWILDSLADKGNVQICANTCTRDYQSV